MTTENKFMVGAQGLGPDGRVGPIMPPRWPLKKADALNLAAWLVALADDNDEFDALLKAVRET